MRNVIGNQVDFHKMEITFIGNSIQCDIRPNTADNLGQSFLNIGDMFSQIEWDEFDLIVE